MRFTQPVSRRGNRSCTQSGPSTSSATVLGLLCGCFPQRARTAGSISTPSSKPFCGSGAPTFWPSAMRWSNASRRRQNCTRSACAASCKNIATTGSRCFSAPTSRSSWKLSSAWPLRSRRRISSSTRGGAARTRSGATSAIAASVSGSTWKLRRPANFAARRMRTGSSRKRTRGSPIVRMVRL